MSANQPPFPGRPDQHGRLEPLDAANANCFSPPRLRPGLGPMNSPFGLPSSDVAPSNSVLYGEQTQYVTPDDETIQGNSPSSPSNFLAAEVPRNSMRTHHHSSISMMEHNLCLQLTHPMMEHSLCLRLTLTHPNLVHSILVIHPSLVELIPVHSATI